ncbi:MAG: hypothetical protein R3B98_10030 [Hyphomonas sp.]
MSTPVEIEIDGKTYTGSWSADGHLLTTRYRDRALTDEVRTIAPAVAARGMLRRLVRLAHEQHQEAGN